MGPLGESNWAVPRKIRRETILLMHSLKEDLPAFKNLLEKVQPNLLLIGAMSLCLPGAVACARKAKEMFGNEICVVLGGRHATETIYSDQRGVIIHHPGSPLRLIAEGYIEPVFDLVVSGEGEHIIAWIGEKVDKLDRLCISPSTISAHHEGVEQVHGRWILGWTEAGQIYTIEGKGSQIDRNFLPPPCEMFSVRSSLDVFGGRLTAHVSSDTGNGCVYNCKYCSERRSVTGPLVQLETSPERLFRQLQSAVNVIREDSPSLKASAFVEDSTMLAGSNVALWQLVDLLAKTKLDLRFGGQFTVDQILSKVDILKSLKEVGLDYIFVGIETLEPSSIGGMNKDVKSNESTWLSRAERAIEVLTSLRIQCGASLLFGLGETHESRIKLLHQIEQWRTCYGSPDPISLNWAVQHPLRGDDGGANYRYLEWGIPPGSWLEAFQDFGEASFRYPLAGQNPPILYEVQEIRSLCRQFFGIGGNLGIQESRTRGETWSASQWIKN